MLEAALLHPLTLYDPAHKTSHLDNIPKYLREVRQCGYSGGLVAILTQMLDFRSACRPTFAAVLDLVEADHSILINSTHNPNTNTNNNHNSNNNNNYIN